MSSTHDDATAGAGGPGTVDLEPGDDSGTGGGSPRRDLTFAGRLRLNRRTVQIALGVLWIIDAGLQFQPKMFGSDFITMVIAPNASGQPAAVASSINHMANFLNRDVALWNTLFALTQLAIGVGLLVRRMVRPALVVSFLWAFGVWWMGEGFGGLLTGGANGLAGAPGAVLLYAVIGVLVWPRAGATAPADAGTPTGMASAAAARGPLGPLGALWTWAGLWVLLAVLQLQPQNRTAGWLHDTLTDPVDGQPRWYAHFLNSLGHAFTGAGAPAAVIMAALFVTIGIGPFLSRRVDVFVGLGIALNLVFWITAQAGGSILTGMATDVSTAPLIILLGLAVTPTVLDPAGSRVPLSRAFDRHRRWATVGLIALVTIPVAVAVVPESSSAAAGATPSTASATSASSSSSTSGSGSMAGMSGMSGSGTSSSATSSGKGDDANSMDMSGMGGLGVTDPGWKYTGPPLSAAETALLSSVGSTTDKGHAMQTPNCTTAPTADQVLGAVQYVQATSAAVAKYKDLNAAVADGYRPITSTAYPIVHYLNAKYMRTKDILNPNTVDSLVYAFTPYGPVLVAAMYLLPNDNNGPMPYGCLVQWHAHTNLCFSTTTHVIAGFTPCAPGTVQVGQRTQYMTHVWQVPVAGGPLAIDPSDLQVMQAAIMAQQSGSAPTTTPVPA